MQGAMQRAIRQDYNHIVFYIIIKMQNIVLSMRNASYKSYSTRIKDKQEKDLNTACSATVKLL